MMRVKAKAAEISQELGLREFVARLFHDSRLLLASSPIASRVSYFFAFSLYVTNGCQKWQQQQQQQPPQSVQYRLPNHLH